MNSSNLPARILAGAVLLTMALTGYLIVGAGLKPAPTVEAQTALPRKPELVIQNGHANEVSSVAFSPDGKFLASGSFDNTIKFWDVSTGRLIRTLERHVSISSIAFSPDGKILASGSYKTVRIWDVNTGRLIGTFEGHSRDVTSVSFSPDGSILASASNDNTIKLWEVGAGQLRKTIMTHPSYVHSVAFSPDGRVLASGGQDFAVRLWNGRTGKPIQTLAGHSGVVESIVFRSDGKFLASGSSDGSIKLWEVKSGRLMTTLVGHAGPVLCISYRKDGRFLASGGDDSVIKLWDMSTGRVVWSVKGHDAWVKSVAFSPDGALLASGSWDKTVKLWDVGAGRLIRSLDEHAFIVNSLTVRRDGRVLASAGNDNGIKLWDMKTGGLLNTLRGHEDKVTSIAFSPDGTLLASGSDDNTVNLWDGITGRLLRTLNEHSGSVFSVSFSPDGALLASAGGDKTVKIWDLKTGQCIKTFDGHAGSALSVSFSPDGKILASGSQDKTIMLWDLKTGQMKMNLAGHSAKVNYVTFSPDGGTLASGSADNTIRLWDAGTGRFLKTLEGGALSLSFSPDGSVLASGSLDGAVKLWDIQTGRILKAFYGHAGSVNSVVFCPALGGGGFLISAGIDDTIKIWDTKSGIILLTILPIETNDWAVYTPEGYYDTTPNGRTFVGWTVGMTNYSFDLFSGESYMPGLFQLVMNGQQIAHKKDLRNGFGRPPEVSIVSPMTGAIFNIQTVNVIVKATDYGGGALDIRLYHNGKLVGCANNIAGSGTEKSITRTFPVSLLQGRNALRATAYSRDNIEALPSSVEISNSIASKKADLYIIAIGVNNYKNPDYKLKYARSDAEGILRYFTGRSGGLFGRAYQRSLLDSEATRANIITSLKIPVSPEDVAIIYLAGRCAVVYGKYYFLPHDISDMSDETVKRAGVSQDEIIAALGELQARKVLLILDTHFAGAQDSALRCAEKEKAVYSISRLAGAQVLSLSDAGQPSELQISGYGIFTLALIEGLCGLADSNGDHMVQASELLYYVHKELPGRARQFAKEQFVNMRFNGNDFPLAVH